MKLLALLIGMVLIVESIPYVAAPEAMKDWLKKLSDFPADTLRGIGLACMITGLLICWVAK